MMAQGVSVLLITSAVGFWVLTIAQKEKTRVKQLGSFLGLLIIVLSLAGAACKVYCMTTGFCPMMGGAACGPMYGRMGKACPFAGKAAAPADQSSGQSAQ